MVSRIVLIIITGTLVIIFSIQGFTVVAGAVATTSNSQQFDVDSWANNVLYNNNSLKAINIETFPGEECYRSCSSNGSRVCYFKFTMEHYHAMGPACGRCTHGITEDCFETHCLTGDGVERGVMSINRKIPGPSIHVCQNDLVVVDVVNAMAGTAAALHWHGFHMRDTPHMDGVPYITQCPISFANEFRYSFWATESGTQFYHSHAGHHKVNGHYGAIIVRKPTTADTDNLYDFDLKEHTILVSDWMHDDGEMFVPGLPTRKPGITATNALINGKGQFYDAGHSSRTKTPLEIFKVQPGYRYRFRFINSASHVCPVQLQVEGHRLQIIASDSYDTQPTIVDTLVTTSGERYDFVLNASHLDGDFCIRVSLLGQCKERDVKQSAILSYADNHNVSVADYANYVPHGEICDQKDLPHGRFLNHPNTTCNVPHDGNDDICASDLRAAVQVHDIEMKNQILYGTPNETHFIEFNNYLVQAHDVFKPHHYEHFMNPAGNTLLVAALNNISMTFPPISLLTQTDEWTENMFCDKETKPKHCNNVTANHCHCVHRIKIKLNSIVELKIVDVTAHIGHINHPFHLHGYPMYVTRMGQLDQPVSVALLKAHEKQRTSVLNAAVDPQAPLKDTISIPSKGYTYVRFKADNPGFWLLHCHFEYHMSVGMGLVVQVGEKEDFVRPPKNFPKCGNFKPDIDESVINHQNNLPNRGE